MVLAPLPSSTQMVAHPVGSSAASPTRPRSTPLLPQPGEGGSGEGVRPDHPHHGHRRTGAPCRVRLVGPLASRGDHATVPQHRFAPLGQAGEAHRDVDVDRAEDDDHDNPKHLPDRVPRRPAHDTSHAPDGPVSRAPRTILLPPPPTHRIEMNQSTPSATSSDGSHVGYRLTLEPCARRIRGEFGGERIVDSDRALVMHETRLAPVHYFPRGDVRMDLMEKTAQRTHCPFKGNASYWTLKAGGREARNVVWAYEEPYDEAEGVRDCVAFYWDAMDAWFEDGAAARRPAPSGKQDDDNPFVDWLVGNGCKAPSSEALVESLVRCLIEAGMPVSRLRILIRTLHPQLFAMAYSWDEDTDEVTVWRAPPCDGPVGAVPGEPLRRHRQRRGRRAAAPRRAGSEARLSGARRSQGAGRDRLCRDAAAVLRRPDQHHLHELEGPGRFHRRGSGKALRDPPAAEPPARGAGAEDERFDVARQPISARTRDAGCWTAWSSGATGRPCTPSSGSRTCETPRPCRNRCRATPTSRP